MNDPTTLVPVPNGVSLKFNGAGMTHAGRVRSLNEDAILTDPTGVLWAIADGMGGHGHGDVAADIVIDNLTKMPNEGDPHKMLTVLLAAANRDVLSKAAEFGVDTMGATVVAVMIERAIAHLAWAGDSRAYLCRNKTIRLLTRDHTVVQELVEEGVLDTVAAANHRESHVITRAVGVDDPLDLELASVPLMGGDRVVLCSDGLTACLDDSTIGEIVRSADDPDTAARQLVSAVLERDAPDNVSVIVVFAEEQ